MLYAWVYFENRFKDMYLPSTQKWSETISVRQSETGWDQDYFISLRSLDGKCFVTPPEKFRWQGIPEEAGRELSVSEGTRYTMEFGSYIVGIVFSACSQGDTAFKKYLFHHRGVMELGRSWDCALRVASEIDMVSNHQGVFQFQDNGSCIYTDNSKNGSYLNGMLLRGDTILLRFGDIITLNAGIKLIYLDNFLAINRTSAFDNIDLTPATPPAPVSSSIERHTPSVQIQFHRSPRFVQKQDTSPIHIEPPMDKQAQNNQPLWLTLGPSSTMVLPMLMGSAISASRGGFMGAGIAMVGTASVLAVFWGLMNHRYRKKQAASIESARVEKYALYISQAEKFLQDLCAQEYKRLQETNPNVETCAQIPQRNSYRLWERMPNHMDFMYVRLGLGSVPLPNKIEVEDLKLSAVDDPLREEPFRLSSTYGTIANAPVTVNLRQETIIGILGSTIAVSLAQSILLQLAALHSYHDVRIAVITDEGDHSKWSWARWLPHVFASEDRELRMVVSEASAVQEVLTHLDEMLIMRSESRENSDSSASDSESIPLPHYVVFCTKPELLDNKPVLRHMLTTSLGMTLVMLAPSIDALPKECRIVLDVTSDAGSIYTSDGDVQRVSFEYPNLSLLQNFSHMVAPLRVKDSTESAAIPTMVSFLDICGVRRIEQLDIWRFWNENHVYDGLRSTIGLRAGSQPFILDISDKAHGPHGLVAGTTGSGKSVMLQTYILSLALNYHPDQIRFILIDYKGGGMADTFRTLPHVTGIIDNLQTGNTIARALASIQGEIHRRELLFRNAGVSNIDDYIRFFYDDPDEERLPHLIIIVDEFAELKADQPDFMQELISASRVGRSLGIHLILSTQKPSNSVSDEIWANSNFRICLRVQTRSDSMEMLRRPDAAYLKNRGRCYIQVGNDEIFEQAQTSYSGMVYNPDEPSESELPHLLDDAGRLVSVKRPKAGRTVREITQMDAVLEKIRATAREHGIPESYHLWMDELPAAIFLREISGSASNSGTLWAGPNTGEELKTVYAMGDDVQSQRQFPVWLDLMSGRNHMVVGMASTGKTVFMQTLIMSFATRYSPDALQMYILSLSSRSLSSVAELPHIGDIIFADQVDELRRLIRLLQAEDRRRRELFAAAATDSFLEYNKSQALTGALPEPSIIVFVDRFAQVIELLGDDDVFNTLLQNLVRESSARGIFFVVSAMKVTEIPYKIRDCFKGIGLQINDRTDYIDIVGMRVPSEMPDIAAFPGRGLAQIDDQLYELQIALAGDGDSDVERATNISQRARELNVLWNGRRPKGIPRIPEHPSLANLSQTDLFRQTLSDPWLMTFSYSMDSGLPELIHLDQSYSFLITGARQSGKTNLLQLIATIWHQRGANICIAADSSWEEFSRSLGVIRYDDYSGSAWETYVSWLNSEIKSRNQIRKQAQAVGAAALNEVVQAMEPIVLIVDDLDVFISQNPDVVSKLFADVANHAAKYAIYLFAAVSHNAYIRVRSREPLVSLARQQRGVALGGKLNECDPWGIQIPFSKKNVSFPLGEAYLINNGEITRIAIPTVGIQGP